MNQEQPHVLTALLMKPSASREWCASHGIAAPDQMGWCLVSPEVNEIVASIRGAKTNTEIEIDTAVAAMRSGSGYLIVGVQAGTVQQRFVLSLCEMDVRDFIQSLATQPVSIAWWSASGRIPAILIGKRLDRKKVESLTEAAKKAQRPDSASAYYHEMKGFSIGMARSDAFPTILPGEPVESAFVASAIPPSLLKELCKNILGV